MANDVTEVTVILKDEDRTFRKKFLVYDPLVLDTDNQMVKGLIDSAIQEFPGNQPDNVILKTSTVCR